MIQQLENTLKNLREKKPLVLCLTNTVSVELVANSLLSMGAAPIMSHDVRETEELVALSGALYINLGTLHPSFIEHCHAAAQAARRTHKPIILDPVGTGATHIRTKSAQALLPYVDCIRGNASEIMALSDSAVKTLGVESTQGVDAAKTSAQSIAKQHHCTVAISGATDYITDGNSAISHAFGSPLMTRVTGMGCALTGVIAAFCATMPSIYEATSLAIAYFGHCGSRAQKRAHTPGSFKSAFIDELYTYGSTLTKTHS